MLTLVNVNDLTDVLFCYLVENDALVVDLAKSLQDQLIDKLIPIDTQLFRSILIIYNSLNDFKLLPFYQHLTISQQEILNTNFIIYLFL